MLKIGVLCSGGLGLDALTYLIGKYPIGFVMTDASSKAIIAHSKTNGIPCFVGNPRNGRGYAFIKDLKIDVLASINYLFLIEKDLIDHPNIMAFNIHGSLLPKYRGRTPHVWAIINNERETGISAHKIELECDTGSIIKQVKIKIGEEDTGSDMLDKYRFHYPPLLQSVLHDIENDNIKGIPQDERMATYFPKRTPEDGEICWNWYKERIRNWIRAQAKPYPGAFSYYGNEKVIIDKAHFVETGFDSELRNGTILQTDPYIVVKTCNGALSLEDIRANSCNFQIGKRFGHENRG